MWAPHLVHGPLEVPQTALDRFAFIDDEMRRKYAAMVYYVDKLIGRVVAALQAKGMWDDLIWWSASDNGGPVYKGGGGNNHPLRGAKMSNWEGGVRVNAYLSGGYLSFGPLVPTIPIHLPPLPPSLPPSYHIPDTCPIYPFYLPFFSGGYLPSSVHGSVAYGLSALCDVYTTLCALAGVDPTDNLAAAAGLPPVDGVNLWPWIIGEVASSPRIEVPLGAAGSGGSTIVQGLIRADGWKLLTGEVGYSMWQGSLYPNKTSEKLNPNIVCDCGTPTMVNLQCSLAGGGTSHHITSHHPIVLTHCLCPHTHKLLLNFVILPLLFPFPCCSPLLAVLSTLFPSLYCSLW